ncbi:hypothetical protein B0T17DRAFT_653825 [Bombardia bombarda]|uniref:CBM1 domain-containing protein n=1 Tax=Bombardia bombarda TaxID=252184 RepID=A0AA39XB11_9PEZI|nr:hypothetical protein B0T17DRAFT_653825 [Bombardia bombarda]
MKGALLVFFAVAAPALVAADVALYGQCGGVGYTGSTACTTKAVCTSYNSWYYQCVPGTAAPATTATSSVSPVTTSKAVTTTTAQASTGTALKTSTTVASTSSTSTPSSSAGTKYLIAFGDSYSQTGFNIDSTKPSPGNPLGNPALPGWTASGGLNWVGFLASQLNSSTLLTYNFAYGGATTNASLVTPYAPTVLSFVDQVAQFSRSIASHPSYAPWTGADTLVAVWMGVNDVGNSWWLDTYAGLLEKIMDSYFGQLQVVYEAGGRNFVLLGVPPIQKTPAVLASDAASQAAEAVAIGKYNDAIAARLTAFKAKNSGVTAKVVDTTAPFDKALSNPTAYGSPDATCYNGDGVSCLWFNDYHPGVAINKLVAQDVAAAWKGSFF